MTQSRRRGHGPFLRWSVVALLAGGTSAGGIAWWSRSPAHQVVLAEREIEGGRVAEAETRLTPLVRAGDSRARIVLARLRLRQGRHDSAARILKPLPREDLGPEGLSLLGEAYLGLGETQQAWDVYRVLSAWRPDDVLALARFAELTYRHAGLAEALVPYTRLERLEPGKPDWPKAVGQVYMEIDRYELAADAFRRASELAPEDPDIRFALAEADYLRGALADCLANLDVLTSRRPTDPRVTTARAECLRAMGKAGEATEGLDALLRNDPKNTRALRLRAEVHSDLRQFPEALELLERARMVDPEDWRVLYRLSLVYDRLGRRAESRATAERMRELQRDSLERF